MKKWNIIRWFDKNTVIHLRLPFSFFLMPVFLFALSQADSINWKTTSLAFIILHLLIFPSSNGYNSYEDRDKTSIGGLKYPPVVSENLYYATLLLDIAGVLLALFVSVYFSLFVSTFILISRAYSYRKIRLKKFPVIGFLTVSIFQGAFVYLMTSAAITTFSFSDFFSTEHIVCMCVASLFIGSIFPLTQIYQHDADLKDGVTSISFILGYRGTFVFSAILFVAASALLLYYFVRKNHVIAATLFFLSITPVILHLTEWFNKVQENPGNADFDNTMMTNILASTSMNLYFIILLVNNLLAWFE